jgi:alpha-L-arabinofuranosidase
MSLPHCRPTRKPLPFLGTTVSFVPPGFAAFTLLLMGGYSLAVPTAARADATLLAYYPFEEGTGDLAEDAAGRNGAAHLVGDITFSEGKYGSAIECTGFGDWIDTGRSILDTTHSFSVACWIRLPEELGSGSRTMISQDTARVSGFSLQYSSPQADRAAERLSFGRWNRDTAEQPASADSADELRAGQWVHLAGVADLEHHRLQLYVNGALAKERAYEPADSQFESESPGHTILGRGRFDGKPADLFVGKIDEVYLFQGTLAAGDVARIRDDSFLARKPTRSPAPEQPAILQVGIDLARTGPVISPLLFGQNLEHTRYGVWHGLSAQLVANRKFAGPPRVDGLAADWSPIGAPRARFHLDPAKPFAGAQSQQITLTEDGLAAGLAQCPLPLQQGRGYQARLAVRCEKPLQIVARLCDQDGRNVYESRTFAVEPDNWQELAFTFKPPQTDAQARIEIAFDGPGTLWVGAVSILPEDNFHGMRCDVVELLKTVTVPLLRWPGGNFVRDYEWQPGLLPVDRRPPILSTWRSTLPFSHSYDFHEIGTDEFIELCRYLHAEPGITVNLNPKATPPADAAAWVEYCNGDSSTHWGKIRADRGHKDPYGVKYWSIGNEVFGFWMGPTHSDAATYAERVTAYAAAMKKVDPSIILVASGQGVITPDVGPKWDDTLLAQAGMHFDLLSQHYYAPAVPWGAGPEADREYSRWMHSNVDNLRPPDPQVDRTYAQMSCHPANEMLPLLQNVRQAIDRRAPGRHIGIALDEWNVWREWFTRPYQYAWHESVTEAVWAGGMIHMMCREAEPLGLSMGAFFQPVNEGMIAVGPFSANLTPLGQVFALFAVHEGQRILRLGEARPGRGLDVCASISADGRFLDVTMVNRNPYKEQDAEFVLTGAALAGTAAPLRLLTTPRLTPYATFEQRTEMLEVNHDGHVRLHLPRYAVGLMQITLRGAIAP